MEVEREDSIVGKLVTFSGLEGETVKVLNGGRGFVLGRKEKNEGVGEDEDLLYSVLIYAVAQEGKESLAFVDQSNSPTKNISKENLQVLPDQAACEYFKEIARDEKIRNALEEQNYSEALPWLEAFYERWPDEYNLSLTYANVLRQVTKNHKKAYSILQKTVKMIPPEANETLMRTYYDLAGTCFFATKNTDESLDWANKIDTTQEEGKELYLEALNILLTGLTDMCQANLLDTDPTLLEASCRVSTTYLELQPNNIDHLQNAAAMHCRLGRNKEGVLFYRRALATPLDAEEKTRTKRDLSLAQMQCPGAPMEHYTVVTHNKGKWVAIHNRFKGMYKMEQVSSTGFAEGTFQVTSVGDATVDMEFFPAPDPDDLEAFGAADLP
jgi:tetratricopeptide (TPR) repeat protein